MLNSPSNGNEVKILSRKRFLFTIIYFSLIGGWCPQMHNVSGNLDQQSLPAPLLKGNSDSLNGQKDNKRINISS